MGLIRQNKTLNGVSTTKIKYGLKLFIFVVNKFINLIEAYEEGKYTEEQVLGLIDSESNKFEKKLDQLEENTENTEYKLLE